MERPSSTEPIGEVICIGGPVDKTSASLRLVAEELDIELVSRLLSCLPTRVYRKGEALRSGHIRNLPSVWLLNSPKIAEQVLEEQIAWLLASVSSDLPTWEQITKMCRADIFCGLHLRAWNRGFSLSAELMRRLAERRLTLEFDIYCDAE